MQVRTLSFLLPSRKRSSCEMHHVQQLISWQALQCITCVGMAGGHIVFFQAGQSPGAVNEHVIFCTICQFS